MADRVRAGDQHTIVAGWVAQLRHDERQRGGHETRRRPARADDQASAKQPPGPARRRGRRRIAGRGTSGAETAAQNAGDDLLPAPPEEASTTRRAPVLTREQIGTVRAGTGSEGFSAATLPGGGSFRCDFCGYRLTLQPLDRLPECPHCGRGWFRRASIFIDRIGSEPSGPCNAAVEWIPEAQARRLDELDQLVYQDRGVLHSASLEGEWTRVGRARSADLRLDDPTVSRRHAIVRDRPAGIRILDDRSLNGTWVAGRRVIDSMELHDGDRIEIGRFCLCLVRARSAGQWSAA